jgi:hypothetical protein
MEGGEGLGTSGLGSTSKRLSRPLALFISVYRVASPSSVPAITKLRPNPASDLLFARSFRNLFALTKEPGGDPKLAQSSADRRLHVGRTARRVTGDGD